MKESEHNNLVVFYDEVNCVRKPSKQTALELAINLWVKQGIPGNLTGAGIKRPEEFLAEAR
jgi:hypothetical protein